MNLGFAETRCRYALARPTGVIITKEPGRDAGLAESGFRPTLIGFDPPPERLEPLMHPGESDDAY
jgi:hypothetical protein